MTRSFLLVGLLLGSSLAAPAWAERYDVMIDGKGSLAVVDNKVYAVDPPERADAMDWETTKDKEAPIELMLAERPRNYLAVDPRTGEVGLTFRQGPAAAWKLTRVKDGYTIQATAGKYKGWYLSVEEKGERVKRGKGFCTLYPIKLTKEPGPHSRFEFDAVGK